MIDLEKIAKEINKELTKRRNELELKFFEDTHTYEMLDLKNVLRNDWQSISKKIENFYNKFNAFEKATQMSRGDVVQRDFLLESWQNKADYSTNKGSFVHYELEKHAVELYGNYKEVRKPIFECDEQQILDGKCMIEAGKNFIQLMHDRGAYLLDTEVVLGSPEIEAVGQADKFWLIENKQKTDFGFICTDWKTNQPKNFEVKPYTDQMLHPFGEYPNTALYHYHTQLPMYSRLLLDMLKNTKFKNLKLYGCIVVLLKSDGYFEEFRTPQYFNNTILQMNNFNKQ